MKATLLLIALTLAGYLCQEAAQVQAPEPPRAPERTVAVTFDDLPSVAVPDRIGCDGEALMAFTDRLLQSVTDYAVPAMGFVVEHNVCASQREALLTATLTRWLDAGLELANHTATHPDINNTALDDYTASIIAGETVTNQLLAERGQQLRYFRHPYLHSGDEAQKKAALDRFLAGRGYTVGPVTIDNSEWIYARAYKAAADRSDAALMERIGADYVAYMNDVFAFYETFSVDLLGYELPQILLLHANALNADYFDELAQMMLDRGYTFVSLETALKDEAYARGNPYVGPRGLSWLQRWALAEGQETRAEPPVPAWVNEAAGR